MAGHFRLRPRYPIDLRVTVRRELEQSPREVDGRSANIGFGGVFVTLDPPFAPHTRIVLSVITATAWEPLKLVGEVRWVRDARPGVPAGMGISFDALSAEHAIALHRLFCAEGYELD